MGYRNKTYVCFDASNDIRYYYLMKAWKEHEHIDFNFNNVHDINSNPTLTSEITIKRQLRERFANTKDFIILVGDQTRYHHKYVRWEIEQALALNLPVIIVNLNKHRYIDPELCPPIVRGQLAIHVSFDHRIIRYALDYWSVEHFTKQRAGQTGPYSYSDSTYRQLGI
jgi:MTH538 TIR-like domain (DUF1863)